MAKVTIDAKALIKKGVMKDEAIRNQVLAVVGKNDKLLKELKIHTLGLHRIATIGDTGECRIDVFVDKDRGAVTVDVVSLTDFDTVGSATFGYTSFFKCVADEATTTDD